MSQGGEENAGGRFKGLFRRRSRSSSLSSRKRSKSMDLGNWGGILIPEDIVGWKGAPPILPSAPPHQNIDSIEDFNKKLNDYENKNKLDEDQAARNGARPKGKVLDQESNIGIRVTGAEEGARARQDRKIDPKEKIVVDNFENSMHDADICPEYLKAEWHDLKNCPFKPRNFSEYNKESFPFRVFDFQDWSTTNLGREHPWCDSKRAKNLYDKDLYKIKSVDIKKLLKSLKMINTIHKDTRDEHHCGNNCNCAKDDGSILPDSSSSSDDEENYNNDIDELLNMNTKGESEKACPKQSKNQNQNLAGGMDPDFEKRLIDMFNKKIKNVEDLVINGQFNRPSSSKLTDSELVLPPQLITPSKDYNSATFHNWIKKVPMLLKHIDIKYTKFTDITSYLKAFASNIDCTAPYLSNGEYNSLLFTTLDYKSKEQILSFMDAKKLWDIDPASFHNILISTLGGGSNYNARKTAFHSYNPVQDSNVTSLAGFLSKVKLLGEGCSASDLDLYFKILNNLPGHCQTELRTAVKTNRAYDPEYLPSPADILDILSESQNSVSWYFSKNKKNNTSINLVEGSNKSTDKGMTTKKNTKINMVEQKTGFNQNNSGYKPTSFQGYGASKSQGQQGANSQPKQGGGYNPNKSNSNNQQMDNQFARRLTCANCLKRGHSHKDCKFPKLACSLCNSSEHIGPECPIYKGQTPVLHACAKCLSRGKRVHHDTSNCLFNNDTGKHEAKN